MCLASKAGRNYHELVPSCAGQTHLNTAVNVPATTCAEHHGWAFPDLRLLSRRVKSSQPRLWCPHWASCHGWRCRCAGVIVWRVPPLTDCSYSHLLGLQGLFIMDGSVILLQLLLTHQQAACFQIMPSPLNMPVCVLARCCYCATQTLEQC